MKDTCTQINNVDHRNTQHKSARRIAIFGHWMRFKCLILASLIPIRHTKRENYQKHQWKCNLRWGGGGGREGGPSLAPLWKMNVNGTLKAKVKTVIRIQPTAPLIYSQSVAHLWICSILRPNFHGGMSRETAACPRGDPRLCVFAGRAVTCSPPEVESLAFNVRQADPCPGSIHTHTPNSLGCVWFWADCIIIFCQWEDLALRSGPFCSVYPFEQQRRAY